MLSPPYELCESIKVSKLAMPDGSTLNTNINRSDNIKAWHHWN